MTITNRVTSTVISIRPSPRRSASNVRHDSLGNRVKADRRVRRARSDDREHRISRRSPPMRMHKATMTAMLKPPTVNQINRRALPVHRVNRVRPVRHVSLVPKAPQLSLWCPLLTG